jgi:hypothetical protein
VQTAVLLMVPLPDYSAALNNYCADHRIGIDTAAPFLCQLQCHMHICFIRHRTTPVQKNTLNKNRSGHSKRQFSVHFTCKIKNALKWHKTISEQKIQA